MMSSDDDDAEPRLRAVQSYYFVDDDDSPVSFDVLPFQFDAAEEVPSFKKDVYLRGLADGGLQNVYKQVVAWKLSLDGDSPVITVLCTEGSWIALLKPRPSYEETVRPVLITVEMLHFVRRSPTVSEENMWGHLGRVFNKYDVKPSEDDVRNHVRLIKLFFERDPAIAKSQTLQLFIKEESMEKINEAGSNDLDIKQPFIADDKEREEVVEDGNKQESGNDDDDEEDEDDGDLFDAVCAICDNGGELLCCEGSCMRSFHAKLGDGEDSYCATLGYTEAEVKAIKNFLCKNCEYKQHQCFVCRELEASDGTNAKVFLCNNATCGHFYHPKCVAQLLHPNSRNEALELEKNIVAGISFTCPVHWCFQCQGIEDRTQEPLQFAVCRRCPRSYHRKCLPREISFEEIDSEGIITRAWELSKRTLIYCLDHDMDLDIGTPSRDHLKFPRISKPVHSVKKKVKELAEKKRRVSDELYVNDPMQKSSRRVGMKGSFERPGFEPEKKKVKNLKGMIHPEEPAVKRAAHVTSPKQHVKGEEQELESLSSLATGKTPQSSFPVIDVDTEKRVLALVEKEVCSLTLDDISRQCAIPSTYTSSGRQIDKIIARGKLERSIQAVQDALQKLEHGGTIDDAKAVCEAEVLRQLTRWNNKLRVYLAPFIHGMRYTSFGRHFTKREKLNEIVDKLQWYVQPGDTIVDFSCGLNDFSQFMKEKLDKVGKKCNFKNYDIIRPKNSFCFEKRDWMTVRPKELPHGSKLIMGLNPPFGLKTILANKFIDKALTFKPKLIVLIVPKETERLDQKRQPYDLVWEDAGSLSGKSFYLPGSLDVADKQMDQWNVSPPPLYLWSRPDWTQKHRRIAEEHGHSTLKVVSHTKGVDCLFDDIPTYNNCEFPYEQNGRYDTRNETYIGEDTNFVVERQEQVNGLPPEKHVEVTREEKKFSSRKSDACQANLNGVHLEARDAHSGYKVHYSEKIASHTSRRVTELERTGDATKPDSDMSISPSDSRNSQYKSRSDSPICCEYPSQGMAHQDNYFSNPAQELCTSPLERVPSEDYIRDVAEYGVASVEKHLAISADNIGAGPYLKELNGVCDGGPNSNLCPASGGTGGSFYRNQNLENCPMDYSMENTGFAQRNAVAGVGMEDARMYDGHIRDNHTLSEVTVTNIRAQIRMYGGHTGNDHPQAPINPPATDIRAQIRMYGRQGTQTSGYPGSADTHSTLTSSLHGVSSLGSTGRSMIDMYTPRLHHETNYTTGLYSVPGNRSNMTPNPFNFTSRPQYPYPHPGSFGDWHG
ncbi:protein ENHANCED DOWNY MILDEW 2-like isoform X2 [Panicum miliaceum]|uniref:Protein ENHANCED DOWNY MILDEW 2-like isoform X2 n=1 Tax=Panicum miliaceum TaxID=4540 RepID=A0A3L6RGW0_PANMI|nr:protein ENHANCED DOWNY MILDEW 2-like isoform X2 [Panicum miliaceum]